MLITDPLDLTQPAHGNHPDKLTDEALIEKVAALATVARESTAELIEHLVELERRNLHLAGGFSSLFGYCRHVLRFSEPESYQRMQAAHVARRFPVVLPLLADGRLHLAGVRLLAPHLQDEDHLALIGGALGQSKRDVEKLLARWFPKPDVPSSIRKIPEPRAPHHPVATLVKFPIAAAVEQGVRRESEAPEATVLAETDASKKEGVVSGRGRPVAAPVVRASIEPLSEASYCVKLTASEAMIGRLRRAQELLSHAIPDGDIVEILDCGLMMVIAAAAREKHAATDRPRKPVPPADPTSRTIPAHVQRAVTDRDGGQCAFVGREGRRCEERRFLQYHHLKPWAAGGPPTSENIALRCNAHNKFEAKKYFHPIRRAMAAEGP